MAQINKNHKDESKELVPVEDRNVVLFDPQRDVSNAQLAAKAIMSVLKPMVIQNKKYFSFEHWQTIGKFFRESAGIEWTKRTETGYEARAIVYNSKGEIVGSAEAECNFDEPNWRGKPIFQVRSMAQTRAMAKALRSKYGFVAVLAGVQPTPVEEMVAVTGEVKSIPRPERKPNVQMQKLTIMNLLYQVSGLRGTDGLKVIKAKVTELTKLELVPENYIEIANRLRVLKEEKQNKPA